MKAGRKLIAVFSLVLLLVSSSSFSFGMHWCGGNLQDLAWFDHARQCPGEKELPPCHTISSSSCCESGTIIHEGNEAGTTLAASDAPEASSAPALYELFEVTTSLKSQPLAVCFSDSPPSRSPVFLTTRRILL